MPTRKQRRRDAKQKRHEYEYVYVDSEGNELDELPEGFEPEPEPGAGRRNGKPPETTKSKPKAQQQQRGGRSARTPQPPSWRRATRRGLILGAFALVFFAVLSKGHYATAIPFALGYTVLFIPFTYAMDRFAYSRWQRRQESRGSARGAAPKKR
jgi:hypothetical protein